MKKICILVVMIITNFCANYFTGENQESLENIVQTQNEDVVIESVAEVEKVEKEVEEIVENEVEVAVVENEVIEEKQESVLPNVPKESTKIPTTPISQEIQNADTSQIVSTPEVPVVEPEQTINATSNITETNDISVVIPEPTPVQETKSEPTQSDLEYWCVEDGSHHVLGDGANEHGYYSSWDEAYSAFESYTSGWQSLQFKIDQCACGLYYFWAIQ